VTGVTFADHSGRAGTAGAPGVWLLTIRLLVHPAMPTGVDGIRDAGDLAPAEAQAQVAVYARDRSAGGATPGLLLTRGHAASVALALAWLATVYDCESAEVAAAARGMGLAAAPLAAAGDGLRVWGTVCPVLHAAHATLFHCFCFCFLTHGFQLRFQFHSYTR
jgi:GNAT superfamily N-acetyltransferase